MTFRIDLSSHELAALRLAVIHWRSRSEREAEQMEKYAAEVGELAEKCEANARASRHFIAEADALLGRLEPSNMKVIR